MLKKRVAAALTVRNGLVVQSIAYQRYLPVGRPEIAVEFLNKWGVDEIILLDISASPHGTVVSSDLVRRSASKCFVPLAVGGGLTRLEEVDSLFQSGADKVCINRANLTQPELLSEISEKYGHQSVIAAVDVIKVGAEYFLYDYIQRQPLPGCVRARVRELEARGAGEILVSAIHKDGAYTGYDIELLRDVCQAVQVPVIALGGARHAGHFVDLFRETGVAAGCAGNMFHFTEHSVNLTKQTLNDAHHIRLDGAARYDHHRLDADYRLRKLSDEDLDNLLFVSIEKEVI